MLSYFTRFCGFSSSRSSIGSSSAFRPTKPSPRPSSTRRPLRLEALEDRRLLSVTPYVVDSLGDIVAEDGFVTLREAIQAANTNAIVGDAHAGSGEETDVITFSPEVFGGMIDLEEGRLEITDSVDIRGPGVDALAIGGSQGAAFLILDASDVAVSGLTIRDVGPAGMLAVQSELTVSDVAVYRCRVGIWAVNHSTLAVSDSVLSDNESAHGGGIRAYDSDVTVMDCDFTGNTAQNGGAIWASGGSLSIAGSHLENNFAYNSGGAVLFQQCDSVTVTNSTIVGNSTHGAGAGIFGEAQEFTLEDSVVSNNEAGYDGGGIDGNFASARIVRTSISGNVAGNMDQGWGGGLKTSGTLTLRDSAVISNVAGTNSGIGGGIYHQGPLSVTNCTVSGNTSAGVVGGVYGGGPLTMTNCTVTGNTANMGGGLLGGSLLLVNSVVAGNTATTDEEFYHADVLGSFDPAGHHNFIGVIDESSVSDLDPNTQYGTVASPLNPLLNVLGFYGGPTPSHAPLPGSPLLDAGDDASAVDPEGIPLATDQRGDGFARIVGAAVDIGAVEGTAGSLPAVEFDGPSGQIDLSDTVETHWSVDGSPLEMSLVFYADGDDAFNGNEIILRTTSLDDRAEGTWTWMGAEVGLGVYTLGVRATSGGTVISDTRAEEAVEITGSYSTYVVNSTADTIARDGVLTLREAIEAISTGTQIGDAPAPVCLPGDYSAFVAFDKSLRGETIVLTEGELEITQSVSIQGPGPDLLTIDAGGEERAFAVLEAGNVWISGLTIENGTSNSNQGGGAVYADQTELLLDDMVVRNCDTGAISVDAGMLSITDSTFANNEHGAVHIWGNYQGPNRTHTIDNCLFLDNGRRRGNGALFSRHASVVIMRSTFQGNQSREEGAVHAYSGDVHIVDSKFSGNQGWTVTGNGSLDLTITNSTLAGNGAGVAMYGYDGNLTIENSILFNEGQTEVFCEGGDYHSTHSLVGIAPHFIRDPSDGGDGWGDSPETPSVDESANNDYGDLRLRVDSPARDEGDNALLPPDTFDLDADGNVSERLPIDLAGNPRIQGGIVDIGAYEFIPPTLPGDLNADNVVNSADLDLIRVHWLESVTPGDTFSGDANGDGTVNSADLDLVRDNWSPATQAAAADAIFADAANETQSAVYGPVPKAAIANNARRDFASLADYLWEKPSIPVRKLALGSPYRT